MKLGCCFSLPLSNTIRRAARFPFRLGCLLLGSLAYSASAADLSIAWDDNSSDESGFKIERALNGSTTFTQIAQVSANVTTYLDTGLSAGSQYSYRVRAFNSAGNSAYSNTVSHTVSSSNSAPTISSISNQTIDANTSTSALSFTVGDSQTSAGSLSVSGTSSNITLVPNANIAFGGSGSNRTVTVTPASNKTGTATITVTVSDGSMIASTSFTLTVNAVAGSNTSPTISTIANQTLAANSSSSAIPFKVSDAETAAVSLTVSGSSSNTTLIPNQAITFGGSSGDRTITITPAKDKTGTATITVTVSDGSLSAKSTFTVTVATSSISPDDTAPTITKISNQTITTNSSTSSLGFKVDDGQTAAGSLTVAGASSNTTLVPMSGIKLDGTGSNRTVTITPAKGQTGSTTVTLTVSDGVLNTNMSFDVEVVASNGSPQFTTHPESQTAKTGASVTFTVAAVGSPSPSYEWRKDGVTIAGATGSTLTLSDVQPDAAGFYDVVATNKKGSATSSAAVLTVNLPNYAGTYFGTFTGGGTWALYVRQDQTATFIATYPSRNLTLVLELLIETDGSFVLLSTEINSLSATSGASALALAGEGSIDRYSSNRVKLAGKIKNGTVVGELSDLAVNFNGSVDAEGPSGKLAGLHTATAGSSSMYSIVGGSGQTVTVIATPAQVDAATGVTQPNGSFSSTTASGGQVITTTDTGKLTFTATYIAADSTSIQLNGRAEHAPSASRLVNVSIRTKAGSGSETLIAGFVVKGGSEKSVLVRAIGPTLTNYGVSGVLDDPTLSLFSGQTLTMSNDNWGSSTAANAIMQASQRVGAFPLLNGSRDSVLLTSFSGGAYSTHVSGKAGSTGVTLLELYDADSKSDTRLINVSARSHVGTGDDVQIVGFYIAGDGPRQVLIRAIGPSLSAYGVSGVLANPTLRLYRGSTMIKENDDWSGTTALAAAFSATGAFELNPASKDAAILVTLEPGAYSAIVTGANGGTGVGLLELYEMP